jgi:MoaA/NifB/PqqE/SkfB family radical SAM enzyme
MWLNNLDYKPRLVFWEVTKGMQSALHPLSRHRYQNSHHHYDLPTTKALNLIKQVSQSFLPILVLSGGEPLFRQDIFDLASYAASLGMRVALATNGTLVDKQVARRILESGVTARIHQSGRRRRCDA